MLHPHTLDVKVTRAEHFSPAIPAESRLPMRLPRRPDAALAFVEATGHPPGRAVRRCAPLYSMTSSARSRIDGGIARPSVYGSMV